MKLTRFSFALACVLAVSGCSSSKPPEETPAETPKVDKAREAEENKARAAESYDAAVKAEESGEYMKARDGYLKVQTYVPDYKDTAARLKNLEDVIVAQQKVDAAPAGDAKKADLMVDYAGALRRRGDLDRAMDAARKAVDANPTLASARAELATIDFEAGLGKEAADEAQKAVDADPKAAEGYYHLAFLHRTEAIEGASRDKALEYAQKAAANSAPNDWKAHELLASIYRDAGDMDKALASLKEAVRASGGLARLTKKYEAWGGKLDVPPPDKPAEAASEKPAEKPAEGAEKPAEKPAEGAEKPAEKPAEGGDKPAEKPPEGDKPAEGGNMGGGEQPK